MTDKSSQTASTKGQEFHKEISSPQEPAQKVSAASLPLDLVPGFNGIDLPGKEGNESN